MSANKIDIRGGRRGLTKAELVKRIYRLHGGLTRREAADVVDEILAAMKTSLLDGRSVKIQNFGVLEVTDREGRSGVDPSSGERIFIPSHRGLSFRASPKLKTTIERRSRDRLEEETRRLLSSDARLRSR
jgi:integration host factor subunit alpha